MRRRAWPAALAVAIGCLAGTLLAPTAQAAFPGGNGKIAFSRQGDENEFEQVYVMNADGSGQQNLSNEAAAERDPAWSPNGQKIAFTTSRDANQEIYVMNANGSNQVNLSSNPAADSQPTWSPDGTQIAFASSRGGQLDIWVMSANGSNPVDISNSSAGDSAPAWSPDGNQIAFERQGEIYVMNANGSNQVNLTSSAATERFPSWSPDGNQIAFETNQDGDQEIYVMNADGSGQMNLSNSSDTSDRNPTFSPDGQSIAYERAVTAEDPPNFEIYVMNANGSGQTNLTNTSGEDEFAPDWQVSPSQEEEENEEEEGPSCTSEGQPSLTVGLALAEGCFIERKDEEGHGTGVFETSEEAWVGGFDLRPNPGGTLVIEPSNHEAPLREEDSGVSLALGSLSVPAPLGELKPFVASYSLGINTVGSLERFLALPLFKGTSGQVTVSWDPGGAGAKLEGAVSIEELSKPLGSLVGETKIGTLAGKLTLKLQNNAPLKLSAGELQLPEFTVEIKGTTPKLKEGFGGATFKAQEVGGAVEWSGEVTTFFPFQERQGSLTARLFLRDSSLSGLGFALSGIQVPIGATGWFLSGVNGNLVLSPELGFDLGVEAFEPLKLGKKGGGPTLFKLTGNVKGLKLATDCTNGSNPFEFVGTTNAPELEAREIGALKAQVLMCAYVPSAKDFAFEAGLSGEIILNVGKIKNVASAKGSASGWFHGVDFNLEGTYQLKLPVFGVIAGQGLLSSEGYAICGQYHFISVGVATHNWLEAPEELTPCDFTPFRAAKLSSASASAAKSPRTVRLRRKERVVALAVRGAKGAPRVRLHGPHGERFTSRQGAKPLAGKAVIIVPEPRLSTTYVYLKRPSAGLWRVQALGGTPIQRIDIAHQLPKPKVSATIRAKGGKEVLSWKARRIPGQEIALIDRTDGVATTLQDFTTRHAGKLRFTPQSPSDAPRTIEADILQNGIPRARLTVARYRTTGSRQRASHVRIARASCGGRTCKAKLRLPAGTRRIRIELRHGKRKIARSSRRAKAGTRTVTLRLHHRLSPGAYTLRVTATLSGGQSTTASKLLHIRQRHRKARRALPATTGANATDWPIAMSRW